MSLSVLTLFAVQNSSIGDLVTYWLTDWHTKTLETCDLWDIWSKWWVESGDSGEKGRYHVQTILLEQTCECRPVFSESATDDPRTRFTSSPSRKAPLNKFKFPNEEIQAFCKVEPKQISAANKAAKSSTHLLVLSPRSTSAMNKARAPFITGSLRRSVFVESPFENNAPVKRWKVSEM